MKAHAVVADSEMSVAKLYTYLNEGNFVLYTSIVVISLTTIGGYY